MLYASVHPDLSDVYACFNIYRGTDAVYSNKLTTIVPITYILIIIIIIIIIIINTVFIRRQYVVYVGKSLD